MKLTKKDRRLRRATRARAKIREIGTARLTVHRTPQHIYAQVIDDHAHRTLLGVDSRQAKLPNGGNVTAAKEVGRLLAEKAKEAGITQVVFDRNGFRYHGRVKALADAAREAGLSF